MLWTNFCQPTVRVQKNFFEQNLTELGSLNLYSSFSLFCIQSGQLFESQWAFEICLSIDKSLFFEGKYRRFRLLANVQGLSASRIIDRIGRKRCQKKRTRTVDWQKCVLCIRMIYLGCFILVGTWQCRQQSWRSSEDYILSPRPTTFLTCSWDA